MMTAKTMIHEIGHSFNIGAADDDVLDHPFRAGEVYSGSDNDPDPERLRQGGSKFWSIMRAGWGDDLLRQPMEGEYYVFSIQELSTINPQ